MTTKKEKLANNYVWKSEYSKEYEEGYNRIDWSKPAKDSKWEELKTDSGKTIYRLKTKANT